MMYRSSQVVDFPQTSNQYFYQKIKIKTVKLKT